MLTDQDIRYITGLIRIEIIELQLENNLLKSHNHIDNNRISRNSLNVQSLDGLIERLNHPHKELAPWLDFKGNKIFEGDTIIHPIGETGIVNYYPERKGVFERWTVKYDFGPELKLILQIGNKGRAVVKSWLKMIKMTKQE